MKQLRYPFFIAAIFICSPGFGQQSVIAVSGNNTVYTGIKNVIHVAISKYPLSKVSVEASIGLLEKTGTPGEYI